MAPVLLAITNTLHGSNTVWFVGNMLIAYPRQSPSSGMPLKSIETYFNYWSRQVADQLLGHALEKQVVEMPMDEPVFCLENLSLIRFSGYKSGVETP